MNTGGKNSRFKRSPDSRDKEGDVEANVDERDRDCARNEPKQDEDDVGNPSQLCAASLGAILCSPSVVGKQS